MSVKKLNSGTYNKREPNWDEIKDIDLTQTIVKIDMITKTPLRWKLWKEPLELIQGMTSLAFHELRLPN